MTISRRLGTAFLSILFLFGINICISMYANRELKNAVETNRRAMERQLLLAEISKTVDELDKQISLISQIYSAASMPMEGSAGEVSGGASREDIDKFKGQLSALAGTIDHMVELSDATGTAKASELRELFAKLAGSWTIVFENFGVDHESHTKATMELAMTAEPTSGQMRLEVLPALKDVETALGKLARENYASVSELTYWVTLGLFAFSLVVAAFVAYRVSHYLTRGLAELGKGATEIGGGNLSMRIELPGKDELGDLAVSFNDMARKLLAAHIAEMKANAALEQEKKEVERHQEQAMALLLNILPVQVADELQASGQVEPKYFEDVTILFTDFKGFTLSTENLAAEELVTMLHDHFTAFDEIVKRYGIEKIKTIGDSYMCASGLPERKPSHPVDIVLAALEMARAVEEENKKDIPAKWEVRIGIHTGAVVAGVVGIKKFAFDIWGDTVNYASRMESSGVPMKVNLSERAYSRVKDFIQCTPRGKILTKEKKELDMFLATGILPKLLDDSNENPPEAFRRRYRVYFQAEPPKLSDFLLRPPS